LSRRRSSDGSLNSIGDDASGLLVTAEFHSNSRGPIQGDGLRGWPKSATLVVSDRSGQRASRQLPSRIKHLKTGKSSAVYCGEIRAEKRPAKERFLCVSYRLLWFPWFWQLPRVLQ
jgi:hypothetical protein